MKLSRNMGLAALLLTAAASVLPAATVFDSGGPDGVSGGSISGLVYASSFTLSSASTLQGLIFFGSAFVNDVPSQFSGTIGFRILADSAGNPGSSLALGSDAGVVLVDNGTFNDGTKEYRFLVNLGSIALGAGTYWLALHEGVMGAANDGTIIFWNTTGSTLSQVQSTSDLNGLTGYAATRGSLSFQLLDAPAHGVPEPSSWALMLGAGAMLTRRLRRA